MSGQGQRPCGSIHPGRPRQANRVDRSMSVTHQLQKIDEPGLCILGIQSLMLPAAELAIDFHLDHVGVHLILLYRRGSPPTHDSIIAQPLKKAREKIIEFFYIGSCYDRNKVVDPPASSYRMGTMEANHGDLFRGHHIMKSIYDKRFISEAQALKSAHAAGCTEVIKDGKMWRVKTPAELTTIEAPAQSARQAADAAIRELQGDITLARTLEHCASLLDRLNAIAKEFKLSESIVAALDEAIGHRAAELEAEAQATQAQVAAAPGNKPGWVHASSVLKPTKLVWVIADEMYAEAQNAGKPMPSRKEVQDECVRRGIASGTARTQFQHWFKVHNENPERATIDPATGKIIPPAK